MKNPLHFLTLHFLIIFCLSGFDTFGQGQLNYPSFPCTSNYVCTGNSAQNDYMKKYWNYRDRFRKYFTKIGSQAGEGLQAAAIEYNDNPGCYQCGKIKFSDTGAGIGDYMAVLATEYYLLAHANVNNEEEAKATLNELYFVIKAIDRLDLVAENFYSNNAVIPADKNGFFIKDDVPPTFYTNWSTLIIQGSSDERDRIYNVQSGDASGPGNPNDYGNEESQDQLIGMLFGFAHVVKFIDASLTAPVDPSFNYVNEVRNLTRRLVGYITTETSVVQEEYPLFGIDIPNHPLCGVPTISGTSNWKIINAAANPPQVVSDGGNVYAFSFAIAAAADYITGDNNWVTDNPITLSGDITFEDPSGLGNILCPSLHNALPNIPLQAIGLEWHGIEVTDPDLANDLSHLEFQVSQAFNVPILGGNFPALLGFYLINKDQGEVLPDFNIRMMLTLASISCTTNQDYDQYTWSGEYIAHLASSFQHEGVGWGYKMDVFDLVYSALHGTYPEIPKSKYEEIIESAPCSGPYDYWEASGSGNSSSYDPIWCTKSLWADVKNNSNDDDRHKSNPQGDFNGLDFMLLYNLYQICYKDYYSTTIPAYKNNACLCSNQPAVLTALTAANNNQTVTIKRKFPTYLNYGISLPEYITDNTTISATDKIGTLNCLTEVRICGNKTLTIASDGILNIGSEPYSDADMGYLHIMPGSSLTFQTGSHIIVNDKSKIVIEKGGHFFCQAGVNITLNGVNSLFDVQDLNTFFVAGNGESFNLSSGVSGGGTMQLAGGYFTLHSGSILNNTDCKLILKDLVAFQVDPNVTLWLLGDKSMVDVQNLYSGINIGNGEYLNVWGSPGSYKQGELYLHGGTVTINNGGTLSSQGCNIHLGATMILFYKNGATIDLTGDEAVLDIGGELHIGDNATFKFIYNSSMANSGFIRMSAPPDWNVHGSKNLWCGTNCKFALQGAGKDDKILEVAQETLYDPSCAKYGRGALILFSLISGKVEFAGGPALGFPDGARLALAGPCKLLNIHFVNRDQDSWRNVIVFGQENVTIVNDKFEGADAGLIGALYNGHRLSVSNCEFYKCTTGMFKHHGGMTLSGNTFHECAIGYTSLGGTFSDNIIDNTIHDCYMGFDFELGSTPSEYLLTKNVLYNNDVPISIDGGSVSARCNTITNNSFEAIELFNNGNLNMNSTRGAGYNDLSHNDLQLVIYETARTLYLNDGGTLDIQDGYNNLSPTMPNQCTDASPWCSEGCREVFGGEFYYNGGGAGTLFSPECNTQGAYPILYADHNKWKDNSTIPFTSYCFENLFNADVNCTDGNLRQTITITDASPIAQIPDCGTYDNGNGTGTGQRNALVRCDNCEQVPVSINSTTRLDSAIRKGIALLDTSIAQYTQAIDLFSYVLNYRLATPDVEGEAYLTGLAYIYLNTAYSRAIDGKQISVVPPFTTIDANAKKVLDIQKARIAQAITDSVYNTRFYMSIDLANSFRMLQMRDSSIALYNYMQTFADSADLPLVQKWLCYVTSENDYVIGVISIDEFLTVVSECFPHQETEGRFASGYQRPLTPEKQNKLKKAINIYPNPAINQMIISLKNFGSDNKYILIYDCLGNVVKDFGSTSKNEIEENVSNYTKGIYLVKAVSGKQVLTTKFVVN